MNPTFRIFTLLLFLLAASFASAADYPAPTESDFTIRDFKFASGETLPELRLHYRTLGKPEKDAQGKTTNAVLIMHGTTGSGAQFIRSEFAGELFGKDQPLDATKFFIVLPDGIGHGKSSKPSDGLRAKFPTNLSTKSSRPMTPMTCSTRSKLHTITIPDRIWKKSRRRCWRSILPMI